MFDRNAINKSLGLLSISWIVLGCPLSYVAGQTAGQTGGQEPTTQSNSIKSPQAKLRYVSSSQVEVMAGPGTDFYPTDVLKSGQAVEVHRETADGWLAITPPRGSFSWLPASQGLLMPGGRIVEVTEKTAVSWIGSSLGTAKQYRWQVKLDRGQQMTVIGEQTLHDPESGSKALWYKIVPPAGEYRWIQAKATSEQPPPVPPASVVSQASSEGDSVVDGSSVSSNDSDGQVVQASAQRPSSSQQGQRKTSRNSSRAANRNSQPHQHTDRWADWHAVEFKNGSFSFPGVARMLGMQPMPTTNGSSATAPRSDDPFDLTATYSRGRPKQSATSTPVGANNQVDTAEADMDEPTSSSMAVRQSRGWRDPRQLREERLRGAFGESLPEESALASSQFNPLDADVEVMDAGYEDGAEIGSAVVAASASESRRSRSEPGSTQGTTGRVSGDQAWYGIEQAPASRVARPASIMQANLEEVQVELSTMVAGPEHTWNFAPLAERARYFIEHGQDSIQRGQARLLLERIDSFAAIAHQSTGIMSASAPNPGTASIGPLRALPASSASGVTSAAQASWVVPASSDSVVGEGNNARFDATGWLVPVHSNGRDMPTHALTNDMGRIIVYVTPAPGVNLTRFESQAIGVYGLRGYLPQLKTNHIQIQRVVRLQ